MGFSNQLVSSFADAISKLNTFLAAEGFTTHHDAGNGEFAARITTGSQDITFALQWDTGAPNAGGIYQFLGAYNSGAAPYAQTDDSGNGAASTTDATLLGQRNIEIGNTPVEMWIFTDAAVNYFNCVIAKTAVDAVQFGSGSVLKYGDGDWTGGEYVYGHRQQGTVTAGTATLAGSTFLLDGLCVDSGAPQPTNMEEYAATIHMEDFPGMVANQKWQVNMGAQPLANLGTDRAAVHRGVCYGGFRAGMGPLQWGEFKGSLAAGLIPGYPINIWYYDDTSGSLGVGDLYGPMGRMRDVRGINIENYVLGDTKVIGSDTWHIFPSSKKATIAPFTATSMHQGIMYKEIA